MKSQPASCRTSCSGSGESRACESILAKAMNRCKPVRGNPHAECRLIVEREGANESFIILSGLFDAWSEFRRAKLRFEGHGAGYMDALWTAVDEIKITI